MAILVYAAVSLALGLSGTFVQLAILVNLASLLVYIVVALAAWRLDVRRRTRSGTIRQ